MAWAAGQRGRPLTRRRAVIVKWPKPTLRLYAVGDFHIGGKAANEKKADELAQIIADDDEALVVGLGDFVEGIHWGDRRWDRSELADFITDDHSLIYQQAGRFCKIMEPTRGKWAMLIAGNHETTLGQKWGSNPCGNIAAHMACPYVGGSEESWWMLLRMVDDRGIPANTLKIYVQHGWGGGELRGSDALKMQRLLWRKSAHIVLMAHTHRPGIYPETVETITSKGWEETEERFGVICYPMVNKHGYLARRGGNAPPVGYATVEVKRQKSRATLSAAVHQL